MSVLNVFKVYSSQNHHSVLICLKGYYLSFNTLAQYIKPLSITLPSAALIVTKQVSAPAVCNAFLLKVWLSVF